MESVRKTKEHQNLGFAFRVGDLTETLRREEENRP